MTVARVVGLLVVLGMLGGCAPPMTDAQKLESISYVVGMTIVLVMDIIWPLRSRTESAVWLLMAWALMLVTWR